ncbi:SapC family protein [Thalassotalea ganghwensis]
MISLEPLNREKHQALKVDNTRVAATIEHMHLVDVFPNEVTSVAKELPIFFIKDNHTGQFNLIALMGLSLDENLMVENGVWQGRYLPLKLATQPLFYHYLNEKPDEVSIVVNTSDERLQANHGQPLFSHGQASPYLTNTIAQLNNIACGYQDVDSLVAELLACDLLESVSLEITLDNSESLRLEGLYTINEAQLRLIEKSEPWISLVENMIVSQQHVKRLIELKNSLIPKSN